MEWWTAAVAAMSYTSIENATQTAAAHSQTNAKRFRRARIEQMEKLINIIE